MITLPKIQIGFHLVFETQQSQRERSLSAGTHVTFPGSERLLLMKERTLVIRGAFVPLEYLPREASIVLFQCQIKMAFLAQAFYMPISFHFISIKMETIFTSLNFTELRFGFFAAFIILAIRALCFIVTKLVGSTVCVCLKTST